MDLSTVKITRSYHVQLSGAAAFGRMKVYEIEQEQHVSYFFFLLPPLWFHNG